MTLILLAGLLVPMLGGCATVRVTNPQRTATEQFLLSESAAKAVEQLSAKPLRDRLVYVSEAYFEAVDGAGILGELRAHLLSNGVRLTNDRDEAQIILEVRSRAVGIDRYDYLLGLPPILIPADEGGDSALGAYSATLITPEIALLKRIRQRGYASIAYVAYWKDTGEWVYSSGPFVGRTEREDWWYFGIGPSTSGNVPPAEEEP